MKNFIPVLLIFIASCQPQPDYDLVVRNVHIVDTVSGELIENRTITIQDGAITGIENSGNEIAGKRVIDGTGKYLIPGLWDMHVHFRGGEELTEENRDLLPLYIVNGVTTIRDAGGDITPAIQEWIGEIEAGELTGPRIFTPGPKLDGPNASWAGSIPVESENDIDLALDSLEVIGADYVKIYDSTLHPDLFLPIIDEAVKRGLPVTGHMPFEVIFSDAVEHGLTATEHIFYAFKGQSPEEEAIRDESLERRGSDNPLGMGAMLARFSESQDSGHAAELHQLMIENGTGIIPTLHIMDVLANLKVRDHSDNEYLSYIGPGIEETYQGRLQAALRAPDSRPNIYAMPGFGSTVTSMMRNGVTVYAGSDAGPFNTFIYPGLSLHRELEKFVENGFTPAEALRTATVNPPSFFGLENQYGQVKEGFTADLVLLDENPLEDITHARSIQVVIQNGTEIHSKEDLAGMLDRLREKYE